MSVTSDVLFEDDQRDNESNKQEKSNEIATKETTNKIELDWFKIIAYIFLHVGALYGIYLLFISAKVATTIFAFILTEMTLITITAGTHRLWSHRSYKAKWPLRLLFTILQTISLQGSTIFWARTHRVHHKYADTNADPHNSKRGFFFCHIGWLLCRENTETREKLKEIDVSDLYADPILRFQDKYYILLMPFACFVLPAMIAVCGWNESWANAFFITAALRWVVALHFIFLVNSVAHMYGYKSYDRNIQPVQNKTVAVLALGEGWHNYHHAFPWDYRTSEFGSYSLNLTTAVIDFFAWLGWAYDLKTTPINMIQKRVLRTGDGTHEVWGRDDKDLTKDQ